MIILGIDPGTTTVGFGLIKSLSRNDYETLNFGVIKTKPKIPQEQKLVEINKDLKHLMKEYKPELMSVEKVFFNKNVKTAMDVSQSRGICILQAGIYNIDVKEYTPVQIKSTLVGYGRAEKMQVQLMVKNLLNLESIPKPDDAADALAVAICAALEMKEH